MYARAHTLALTLAFAGCGGSDANVHTLVPDLAVVPGSVDFGDIVVLYDDTQPLAVVNAGKAPLEITNITVSGNEDGVFTVSPDTLSLEGDEGAALDITFAPGTYVPYSRSLVLTSNDPENPTMEVPLTGEGVDGPVPDIGLDTNNLDFGDVAPGINVALWITLTNEGDGPLTITGTEQFGSGSFAVVSDPNGQTLQNQGDYHTIVVSYVPTHDQGDNGGLRITSNDPDEPEVEVLFLGNGGGDFEYPTADINCPLTADPPTNMDLDGTGSSDPNDYLPLTYAWSLTQAPSGSTGTITDETADYTSVFVDLAGIWEVQLKVTNSMGVQSAPAKCEFYGLPDDSIHVELIWNAGYSDVDLHLIQDGFEFNEEPGDCCWCNPNPSWGSSGGADDPVLTLDNRVGYGPENIKLESPADGDYYVRAHYYEDAGGGTVTANVRIWIDGEQTDEVSQNMTHNKVWDVGYIRWPEGVFVTEDTDIYTADSKQCW